MGESIYLYIVSFTGGDICMGFDIFFFITANTIYTLDGGHVL